MNGRELVEQALAGIVRKPEPVPAPVARVDPRRLVEAGIVLDISQVASECQRVERKRSLMTRGFSMPVFITAGAATRLAARGADLREVLAATLGRSSACQYQGGLPDRLDVSPVFVGWLTGGDRVDLVYQAIVGPGGRWWGLIGLHHEVVPCLTGEAPTP